MNLYFTTRSAGLIQGFPCGEGASHGPRGKRGTGECAFSFWSTLCTDDHGSSWETGTGPRHASDYMCFRENFLSYVLAHFALGIWCIISVVLAPGSHRSGRLGVALSMKIGFYG